LVGARCAFAVAVNAFQTFNDVANGHTLNEFAYALQIAVAAAGEDYVFNFSVNHVKVDKSRASAAGLILIVHKDCVL
jgi:hypothetical protein